MALFLETVAVKVKRIKIKTAYFWNFHNMKMQCFGLVLQEYQEKKYVLKKTDSLSRWWVDIYAR